MSLGSFLYNGVANSQTGIAPSESPFKYLPLKNNLDLIS